MGRVGESPLPPRTALSLRLESPLRAQDLPSSAAPSKRPWPWVGCGHVGEGWHPLDFLL